MFGPRNDARRAGAIRAIKDAARVLFEAGDDDAVIVNELRCTEPGCPPVETVVALLRSGHEPRQVKIHKQVVDVTEDDLRAVFAGSGHTHSDHHD